MGILQLLTDGIGTSHRPGVRQLVAEVIEYAQVLRGMVLAAEEKASLTDSGVMWPDAKLITAGRGYALGLYPTMVHSLQISPARVRSCAGPRRTSTTSCSGRDCDSSTRARRSPPATRTCS